MKKIITMLAFVIITGTVLTAAIVMVNFYTQPIIEKNEEIKLKSAVLNAFGIPFGETGLESVFGAKVAEKDAGSLKYYVTEGKDVAFTFAGSGLWGPITGVIALRPDLKTILNVTILHQEETPGLGSRIAERIYLDTLKNKAFAPSLVLVKAGAVKDTELDAITGATMSCNAFVNILNSQYTESVRKIPGGN
jgi:Na+-transporting NADH:ubiquinone oxidoreductase subunit C